MKCDLQSKHCVPCEGGVAPLSAKEAEKLLADIPGWEINPDHTEIMHRFTFRNFYVTMGFVNAVAWMAHQENHHPDMEVGFNYCTIRYSTHAIKGLSENDFICAAKVNGLQKK